MEWAFLTLGVLFVAAVWDIGRRISDNVATKKLEVRVAALEAKAEAADDLSEQVADLGQRMTRLSTAVETQKAAGQRSRGWPRVT